MTEWGRGKRGKKGLVEDKGQGSISCGVISRRLFASCGEAPVTVPARIGRTGTICADRARNGTPSTPARDSTSPIAAPARPAPPAGPARSAGAARRAETRVYQADCRLITLPAPLVRSAARTRLSSLSRYETARGPTGPCITRDGQSCRFAAQFSTTIRMSSLKFADWSKVEGDVDIKIFNEHLGGPDNVIAALKDFAIVCAMRERTGFPRAGDRGAARSQAPDHHRHAQCLDRPRGRQSARRRRLRHAGLRQRDRRASPSG